MVVVAVVLIGAGYVILRRSIGEPLNVRDLAVPPVILLVLGVREVSNGDPLTTAQVAALVGVSAIAVALGALRAATVRLYLRAEVLWYRYRPLTYATWVVTGVMGAAIRLGTYTLVDLPSSAQSLYLTFGLTLAGESLVLAARGVLRGQRFAPESRDSAATRQIIHDEMRSTLRRR